MSTTSLLSLASKSLPAPPFATPSGFFCFGGLSFCCRPFAEPSGAEFGALCGRLSIGAADASEAGMPGGGMPGGAAGAPMPRSDLSCYEATGAALAGAAGTDDFSLGGGCCASIRCCPILAAAASNAGDMVGTDGFAPLPRPPFSLSPRPPPRPPPLPRPEPPFPLPPRPRGALTVLSRGGLSVDGCVSLIVDLSD